MTPESKANIILATVFLLVSGIVLVSMYWIFEPKQITTYSINTPCDEHGQVKTEFKVGEMFFYCRKGVALKAPARVIHQALVRTDTPIEMIYLRFPPIAGAVTKLGPFHQGYRVVELPNYLPPGEYEWRVHVGFTLNALRTGELEEAPPIKFKVVR